MPSIPLEDTYTDILGKAMRGLHLNDQTVAQQAGVGIPELQTLRSGEFSNTVAAKVAPILGLNAGALADLAAQKYQPEDVKIEGLAQFNTPYEDMTVNAYLVWDPATKEAAVFDTGADASGILSAAEAQGLTVKHIFITHTHGDHIFDVDRLREKTGAEVWSGKQEPLKGSHVFAPGQSWKLGALTVESRLTWGHSPGGITYVVTGLERPVAVVGDSIFAGSMGGGAVSYSEAVKNNLEQILTLPPTTVLCPGHGPLTSVGEEKAHNPFFAR
jgi:hydroxyacylglutathione hydrolase